MSRTYNLIIASLLLFIAAQAIVNIAKDIKEKNDQNTLQIITLILNIIALPFVLYTSYKLYEKN
jgi:Flp pilus assembly protein protease CpaA